MRKYVVFLIVVICALLALAAGASEASLDCKVSQYFLLEECREDSRTVCTIAPSTQTNIVEEDL